MRSKEIKFITSGEENKRIEHRSYRKQDRWGKEEQMRLAWQSEKHLQFSQISLVCSKFGNHGFKLKRFCHLCCYILDIFRELDNE